MERKKCKGGKFSCGKVKSIDDFPIRGDTNKRRGQCKDCIKEYKRNYRSLNREKMLVMEKQYRESNGELLASIRKKYNDKTTEKRLEYVRKRRKTLVNVRIRHNLRSRLTSAIKNNKKAGSAVRDLGCSIEKLKNHFEILFYNNSKTNEQMSWNNYGKYGWHIDHIKPLAAFDLTDRKQLLKACHYTNLQPLWAVDNLRKGAKIL